MSKRSPTLSFSAAAVVSVLALVVVAPGCSDEPTDEDACHDYSSFNATSRTVAFAADVLPIFRNSCGLSAACHGSQTGSVGGPYLGPSNLDPDPTAAEIMAIFAQNIGVSATRAPSMKIIVANSPQTSFLMHKIDNTLTCGDVACEGGCGTLMPQTGGMLSAADRDTIRLWIAQGAKND